MHNYGGGGGGGGGGGTLLYVQLNKVSWLYWWRYFPYILLLLERKVTCIIPVHFIKVSLMSNLLGNCLGQRER